MSVPGQRVRCEMTSSGFLSDSVVKRKELLQLEPIQKYLKSPSPGYKYETCRITDAYHDCWHTPLEYARTRYRKMENHPFSNYTQPNHKSMERRVSCLTRVQRYFLLYPARASFMQHPRASVGDGGPPTIEALPIPGFLITRSASVWWPVRVTRRLSLVTL